MTSILDRMGKNKLVVSISEKIKPQHLLKTKENQFDPHIWFDVQLWMKATERVKDALIELDSAHEKEYKEQAKQYLAQLTELNQWIQTQLNTIPKNQRVLATAHDAFGYFGQAYGIEVVGLQGISTASEYGLADVQRLVQLLVDKKIKAVFVESSVPKRSIEAVIAGASAKHHPIALGGPLFSDAMGKKGTFEGTYIGMVKHNVNTIVKGLK